MTAILFVASCCLMSFAGCFFYGAYDVYHTEPKMAWLAATLLTSIGLLVFLCGVIVLLMAINTAREEFRDYANLKKQNKKL